MRYGKYTSQSDRNERKLYPQREPRPRKTVKRWVMTPAEIDLFVKLFGITPIEAQALEMAGITLAQASEPVDTINDRAEEIAVENELRIGG
jgi:hypothetical protein